MATEDSSATLERLRAQREQFIAAAGLAKTTRSGYIYAWSIFSRWAADMGFQTLPCSSETLAYFVASQLDKGRKTTTVTHRVNAIRWFHGSAGLPSPMTREVTLMLRGARRLHRERRRKVLAMTVEELHQIAVLLRADKTPVSARNLAVILVGFCAALRNSNTAMLMLEDVEFTNEGAILSIRRSKTDQEGIGTTISITHGRHQNTCVIRALKEWIAIRGSDAGPLFRRFSGPVRDFNRALTPPRIGDIVQETVRRIGKDRKLYGGHSLRAGFTTETGIAGAPDLVIAETTGHKRMATVGAYFRPRTAFRKNPLKLLDL